jgi:hypothetical protein
VRSAALARVEEVGGGRRLDWTPAVASAVNNDIDVHGWRVIGCRWRWKMAGFAGHGKMGGMGWEQFLEECTFSMGDVVATFHARAGCRSQAEAVRANRLPVPCWKDCTITTVEGCRMVDG